MSRFNAAADETVPVAVGTEAEAADRDLAVEAAEAAAASAVAYETYNVAAAPSAPAPTASPR